MGDGYLTWALLDCLSLGHVHHYQHRCWMVVQLEQPGYTVLESWSQQPLSLGY